jgi:hypothetical protein
MVYTPQTNWKYDKNLYHPIQSGPQRTGDDRNLIDTYLTVSSGYVPPSGIQQTWFGVNDEGADFGRIPVGTSEHQRLLHDGLERSPSCCFWLLD